MEMCKSSLLHLLGCPEPEEEQDFAFRRLQLWDGSADDADTLYLTCVEGSPLPARVLALADRAQVNRALELYQRYLIWREESLRFCHVEHDLTGLLNCAKAFLGWDSHIINREYRTDSEIMGQFRKNIPGEGNMSREDVEKLYYDDPDFHKTFQTRGVQPYPQFRTEGKFLYYYNIFQEEFYLGRMLLLVPMEHRGLGARKLMEQLCADAAECYRFLYLRRREGGRGYRFYDLWRAMLAGQMKDAALLREGLARLGWTAEDTYQILYLTPVGYSYDPHALKFYAVQLESALPNCVAAEMEGGLYCLRNLSAEENGDFRQNLGVFLRESLFRAGISNPFPGFFDSPRYCRQAQEAMALGQKKSPSLWRYDFCDYVSDYVRTKCLEQYPPRDLCPRNLRRLLDYEASHPGSDLVNTLYQYYANQFNAQQAAQKLFIHRTTFFYRMNKIQSIAAFHPEDPEETTQLLLALQALKHSASLPDTPAAP